LLYKGYPIQLYSPGAGTGLSSHELNQPGCYRDVKDTTVTAQFAIPTEDWKALAEKANLPKLDSDYNIPNNDDEAFQNYIKQIIALDKAYMDTNDAKKQKKILKEYDKIAKIIWSKYSKSNIVQGSYDNVDLKALNLKSLDRGVIITKIEK